MEIAIVGMACHYPGAHSALQLFRNVMSGRSYFRRVPHERWSLDDYYRSDKSAVDATYCQKAGFIDGFSFLPEKYRITKRTYESTDVAQWLALQTASEALEDANISELPKETTAVIIGNTLTGEISRAFNMRYRWPYVKRIFQEMMDNLNVSGQIKEQWMELIEKRYKQPFPVVNEDSLAGALSNTIPGRICNYFDLKGGGFTTDGACSSSLLSVTQSCVGLMRGDYDVALSGGVDVSLDPFEIVGFSKVGALTDEMIRVYDENSSGFLPGEGCGIVVLKRLSDAVADRNRIYAVINGVGISTDGKGGLTAPNIVGQSLAVDRAYKDAPYSFADVELIEGHGTGTPVGDNVELTMFTEAKVRHRAEANHRCGIGSIKSNIGHAKAAAGIAGFIKTTLSCFYGFMPPTQGIRKPSGIVEKSDHLYLLRSGARWSSDARRAAVSSAGFGGINTHVTLSHNKECTQPSVEEIGYLAGDLASYQSSEVFFVGTYNLPEMVSAVTQLADAALQMSYAELPDLANYCVNQYSQSSIRLAVIADSPDQLHGRLQQVLDYLRDNNERRIEYSDKDNGIYLFNYNYTPKIAFVYPGQGSQYLNMCKRQVEREPGIRQSVEDMDALVDLGSKKPLSQHIYHPASALKGDDHVAARQVLNDTTIAQPAILATSIALTNYLYELGITPHLAVGHSLGEYAALWSAGAINTEAALNLVVSRGAAMSATPEVAGSMISIAANRDVVAELLKEVVGYVTISNINSPVQTVVSGERSAIDMLKDICQHRGVHASLLPVSNAFHSKLMAGAAKSFQGEVKALGFHKFLHPVISSVTGDWITDKIDPAKYLVEQIKNSVNFVDAVNQAVADEVDVFIEVGPGKVLSTLLRQYEGVNTQRVFSTDIGEHGESSNDFNSMLGYLFASGVHLNLKNLFDHRLTREMSLPYKLDFIQSPCETPIPSLELNIANDIAIDVETLDIVIPAEHNDAEPVSQNEPATVATLVDPDEIFQLLNDFIVKQYGYSTEMVHRDARLQEDLGLDSLKSAEVAFEAMGHYGVKGDITNLGDITITQLSDFIHELLSNKQDPSSDPSSGNTDLPFDRWVHPFTVEFLRRESAGDHIDLVGNALVCSPTKDDLATSLVATLQQRGCHVVTKVGAVDSSKIENINHVFYILPQSQGGHQDKNKCLIKDSLIYESAKRLFGTLKNVLSSQVSDIEPRVTFVTRQDGHFHRTSGIDTSLSFTGAGVIKTLQLENPSLYTRVVDIHTDIAAPEATRLVLQEHLSAKQHAEVGYEKSATRVEPSLLPVSPATLSASSARIQPDDIFLVTGGAKGITAECVLALAKKTGAAFALLGSSAPDNKTGATGELKRNLERFTEAGVKFQYYVCNVLDKEQLSNTIDQIQHAQGDIRGVIHAAGVNVAHRIEKAQWSDIERVLGPKMRGMNNIAECLNFKKLKSFIVFSSIIASSGMMGNADYAYANEWMNKLLRKLKSLHPKLKCQSYNFSVWADVGMGAKTSSVDILSTIGIEPIDLRAGVSLFTDLVEREWGDLELIIMSRIGSLPTLRFSPSQEPKNRFTHTVIHEQPGVELITETLLSPGEDLYLDDHNYEGSLLFPTVIGLEAMSENIRFALRPMVDASKGHLVFESINLERAIVVPDDGRDIRIYTQVNDYTPADGITGKSFIRSAITDFNMDYFSANFRWTEEPPELPSINVKKSKALRLDPQKDLYGKILFQGPMFQHIESYRYLSSTRCEVVINNEKQREFTVSQHPIIFTYGSPLVRDAYLHAVQLCVPEFKILPVNIEKLVYIPSDSPILYLHAQEREKLDNGYIYDLFIYDVDGRCVENIVGFHCRIMNDYTNKDNLKRIRSVHHVIEPQTEAIAT